MQFLYFFITWEEISSDLYRVSGCDIAKWHFPLTCKTKEKFYPALLYTKPLTKSVWVNLPEFLLVCEIIRVCHTLTRRKYFGAECLLHCKIIISCPKNGCWTVIEKNICLKANERAQSIGTPWCHTLTQNLVLKVSLWQFWHFVDYWHW